MLSSDLIWCSDYFLLLCNAILSLLSAFLCSLELGGCYWEDQKGPNKKTPKPLHLLFLLEFTLTKTLPNISGAFNSVKSMDNFKKTTNSLSPGFPTLPILLTVKLCFVSNHMHPNKGFKVWIEAETVSELGRWMQRKLAMFPLLARKAWKLRPFLCQREREALISLRTDFCNYWVPDLFLVGLVCLLLARCGPKHPGKDL